MNKRRRYMPLSDPQLTAFLREVSPSREQMARQQRDTLFPEQSGHFDEVYRDTSLVPVSGNELKTDEYFNAIRFYTFSSSRDSTEGSQQVLAINTRRQYLSIENQSADKDIYVNFGADAAVGQGMLVLPRSARVFDQTVPFNSVHVFVNDTAKQIYVVVEGSPVLNGVA